MKIINFNINNIGLIYESFLDGKTNPNYKKAPGLNLVNILNHVSANMIIEASPLEVFYLKRYTHGNIVNLSDMLDTETDEMKQFPDMGKDLNDLFDLSTVMFNDENIEYKPETLFFPQACIVKRIHLSLRGEQLFHIFSEQPVEFFKLRLNIGDDFRTLDDNHEFIYVEDATKILLNEDSFNLIIKNFIDGFYKYMLSRVSYIDILIDSSVDSHFYQGVNSSKKVIISDFQSPVGSINFINAKPEKMNEELQDAKTKISSLSINDKMKQNLIYSSRINFEICSTFGTFLELTEELPYECFSDMQDIKIIQSTKELYIPEKIYDDYKHRITSLSSHISTEIANISMNRAFTLEKFMLIPMNNLIKYSLNFNIIEIDNTTISNFISDIENGDRFPGANTYMKKEITDILLSIYNIGKIKNNL